MKVLAISGDKQYLRLGEDQASSAWYTKTPEVEEICKDLNKGDEIKISFEKDEDGKKLLKTIEITKQNENILQTGVNKFREPEQLRKDETMRSACLGIQNMVGAYKDTAELSEAICQLYDKIYDKVK